MKNATIPKIVASLAAILSATSAYAHAQLQKATPAVGGTVASATEIRLEFSEGVEPRFSGLTLTAADGSNVPLAQPKAEGGDKSVLVAPMVMPLAPGGYTVHWHAVSADTHHTQGDFSFTVKP
jgi:copper resistance protein C